MDTIHLTYPHIGANDYPKQVLAIGDFDGVHLGHLEVIKRAMKNANKLGAPCSLMTFHPHPREVLGQEKYTRLLTPLEMKSEILGSLGIDRNYVVAFDDSFMHVTPEQFVEHVLVPMRVETVIVGFDFRFGHKGSGTPDTLCDLAKGRFSVEVVRPYHLQGDKVSSTWVRELLLNGQVCKASELLGRQYRVSGEIVHGDGRGKTIGFPTANIQLNAAYVVPARGVYAVRLYMRDRRYDGVMNIGIKPTFTSGTVEETLEVHLFDFHDDIYGQLASVEFISYLRPEQRFSSVDQLIDQIKRDADQSRSLLSQLG